MTRRVSIASALLAAALLYGAPSPARADSLPLLGVGAGAGGSSYTGPLDLSSGWAAWWGLRAASAATAGTKAANICNSGDANCADINTLSNGNFDVTTAQGAPLNCGGTGGTCTIKTLYDKSGNARDLTQATAANRPTLAFGCAGLGTGLPCMIFASGQVMLTANFFTLSQPLTLIDAANQTSNAAVNRIVIAGDIGTTVEVGYSSADNNVTCETGTTIQDISATDGSWFAAQCLANGTGSSITVNGTTTTFSGGTSGPSGQKLSMGTTNSLTTGTFVGKVAEGGISTTAFTSGNLSSMNSNIRTYWGF
jgi:hypothetical protein